MSEKSSCNKCKQTSLSRANSAVQGLCYNRKRAGDTQMAKMLSLAFNPKTHDTVRWRRVLRELCDVLGTEEHSVHKGVAT